MIEIVTKKKEIKKMSVINISIKSLFQESARPQVHYTPSQGWINDPNGLVYDEYTETYHLFAQYSKGVENNGIYGWIHATSKDLINWTEKDIPVLTNSKGDAWSGGAVIDYNNTSGLFNDSVPSGSRMVLFVTYQSSNPKVGIVYSLDHGETWIEYNEFVIKNEGNKYSNGLRDPKVIWYENNELPNGGKWLLIIGGSTTIKLFSSDNLLDWQYESDILDINGKTVVSECPDILKLPLDGDKNNIKYVVSTGGTTYIVGDLSIEDGKIMFRGEQAAKKMFVGPNLWTNRGELYATQSFFNDKLNRIVLLSWVIDRTASVVQGKTWNGAQSLPMDIKLVTKDGLMVLNINPVEELNNSRGKLLAQGNNIALKEGEYFDIKDTNNNKFDLEIELDVTQAQYIDIYLADGGDDYMSPVLRYSSRNESLCYVPSVSDIVNSYSVTDFAKPINGIIKLRIIVDASIVEVYANDGETNFHGLMFPPEEAHTLSILPVGGGTTIQRLEMHALNQMNRQGS